MELTTTVASSRLQDAEAPPWQIQGGVSTLDHGHFADAVVAQRREWTLTKAQIDAVIDEIVRAREAGMDLLCLDPTAPPELRLPAFSAIIRPAIARGVIPDLPLADTHTIQALYDAALGWGARVQPLLDDADVTEVKINGTTALAASSHGLVVVPNAFASVEEPQSRVRALAQMLGVRWDTTHPSVTLPLSHKTRLHATRAPLLPEDTALIVIRRGRTHPWSLMDLVAREALSEEAAELLEALVRARLSLIVSGAQDTGKTTFLECALNALPPHEHVVLVEDNTDEFCLRSHLVTRLQVNATAGISAFATVVRETLRMTPSVMAPGEIRGEEAGAVAQIAEAGRPTMTTIHARSAEAALRRFARLAATDITGNSFARQPEAALRVITESFQLMVHMVSAQRVRRRIVREVLLLDGVDARGMPRLLPLITASQLENSVSWECHAAIQTGALVWRDQKRSTPITIANQLADTVDAAEAFSMTTTPTDAQVASLLARARDLLPYADQAGQAANYLEQARSLAPHQREPWSLAERLLANHPTVQASVGALVRTATQQLQEALAEYDIETIRKGVDTTQAPLLVQIALAQDAAWQRIHTDGLALLGRIDEVTVALNEAKSIAEHDLARALRLLERFVAQALPHEIAQHLLETRIALLQTQARDAGASAVTAINHQLAMAYQQLATLDSPSTAPSEPPDTLSTQPPEQPDEIPVIVEQALHPTISNPAPLDIHNTPPETAAPTAVEAQQPAESLPFRTDSAAEVGDWKRILQAVIARPQPEELE